MPLSNKDKIHRYFARLPGYVVEHVPPIVGETAVELFKENILTGSYDGVPWEPLSKAYLVTKKRNKDKILYLNGLLFASIKYTVEGNKVIASAGSSKVPYARIHNEGLTVNTIAHVGEFTRKQYRLTKKGNRKATGKTSTVRAHTRKMNYTMPRRQFMGYSMELNKRIIARIKPLFKK